jgi:hypothetical protein
MLLLWNDVSYMKYHKTDADSSIKVVAMIIAGRLDQTG